MFNEHSSSSRVTMTSVESTSPMQTTQTEATTYKTTHSNSSTQKRLVWRDIYAEVRPKNSIFRRKSNVGAKVILDHVSGVAEPGEITFLMGASGAGKTTLLNILTQRSRGIKVYGEITVNKNEIEKGRMRKISAYVQQEDVFMPNLTVKETLMLAARLQMPRHTTHVQKRDRVDEVAREMGLEPCLHTQITVGQKKSISRGEKKRLSFACEVLTDPSILFCDEPTSGLDAYMALQVMRALSALAKEGKTIVCSIHQPSSLVFDLADRLVLMAGGRVAYQGPAEEVEQFMKSCGHKCPDYVSIPDHFMSVISKKETEKEPEYTSRIDTLLEQFERSGYGRAAHDDTHLHITSSRRQIKEQDDETEYAATWWTQFIWLLWRGIKCCIRNPMLLQVRLLQCITVAVVVGFMYFQTELNKDTIMTYKGLAFNGLRDMNMLFLFPCIHVFTSELPIVYREYHSAMYHPSAYFMGKNIADSIQYLVLPAVYSSVVYWMAGLGMNLGQFVIFWFISTMLAITSTSIGYAAACVFGDIDLASAITPLFSLPMMVFGGFFIDLRTVPWFFKPLTYLSWYKYAYDAHIINLLENTGPIQGCTNVSTICGGETGKDVLKFGGHDQDYFWLDIGVLFVFFLAWRSLALFALRFRVRRS